MTLPRKASAVVFDMDGLIFDTEPLYRDAIIAAAAIDAGHDIPLDFYLTTIGLGAETTRALFNERFGKAFDFDGIWTSASKRFYEVAASRLSLKKGIVELLDLLDHLQLPRAIATYRATKTRGIILTPMASSIVFRQSSRKATTCAQNHIPSRI